MGRLKRDREEFDLSITDFTGGEPTLHPDIVEIVEYGKQIGNQVSLITHGQTDVLRYPSTLKKNGVSGDVIMNK